MAGFKPADATSAASVKGNQVSVAKSDYGAGRPAPQVVRRDTFLEGQSRAKSSSRKSNLDSFIDNMNIDFSPQSLNQVGKQFEQDTKKKTDKEVLGHTASWWTRPFRTKKTKTEEEQDEDDRLALVQKIRLYMLNFPDLEELHVVKPDKEKFLISLYSKKKGELEKTLNFLTFHTRNSISEKSTMGSAKTVLTIAGRTIEIILGLVGVKSDGLTNDIASDNDLDRCVREIIIENSINTLNYGPKTDALIRICTIVAKRDGMNRQVEYMQRTQTKSCKAPLIKPVPPAPPAPPASQASGAPSNYSDL